MEIGIDNFHTTEADVGRNTLAMVAICAVVGLGVLAIEKTQPALTADKTVYVLEVKDTDVQRLDITTASGATAFERAEPFGWKFAGSGEQADLSRVSSVVNRLAKLRSSAKVTDQIRELPLYRLDPPTDTATLTMKDGTVRRVLIGSKTPNDAAYYALVEGRTDLHTINTLLVGDIEKLVSEPPVPTPVAERTATPTPRAMVTSVGPEETLEGTATPTPTIGLPTFRTE